MKRTNLVLDGEILEEALRLSGERTYSAAVDMALSEFVRRARAERILELAGSGVDCLIAACAIRNSLTVLHRDRDFDSLAQVSELDSRSIRP